MYNVHIICIGYLNLTNIFDLHFVFQNSIETIRTKRYIDP